MFDVIAQAYGGYVCWWSNAWTGWPMMPSFGDGNSPYDAMKYPWMMGTPQADADGDGAINSDEALLVNLATPMPMHTDPTPLWMTDSSSPAKASYTVQYYQMDPDAMMPDFATGAAAWIYAGGAHHAVVSTALTSDDIRLFAKMTGTELVIIDDKTDLNTFEQQLELLDLKAKIKG